MIGDRTPWLVVGCIALAGALAPSAYVREVAILALLQLSVVVGWDVFCGPTSELDFGRGLYVGGGAFVSAMMCDRLGLPLPAAILVAAASAAAAGAAIARLGATIRGAAFSLLTMGAQLGLYQSMFLFPHVFGGEEGVAVGVRLTAANRGWVVGALALFVLAVRHSVERGTAGRGLRAIGDDPRLAAATGLEVTRWKVTAFSGSAALGGAAGAVWAHAQGHVGGELASAELSIRVVLLGLLGGSKWAWSAAVGWVLFREVLSGVPGDKLIATTILFGAVLVSRTQGRSA